MADALVKYTGPGPLISGETTEIPVSAANPLPVTSSGSPPAFTGTYTDRSSTVTLGGTSQQLAAANTSRRQLIIENPPAATESLFFNFGSAASTSVNGSFILVPGGVYDSSGGPVSTQAVNVTAATTAHAFIAKEM